ncbi:hypothetical protein CICLE_v10033257mg [Citrus x clementina]|uniref:Uncharacterized protein n=1 Tax=Citrus clementina TaxID=85681 RepID=V4TBX7_CITCL|nr:hypothetical protein CICLE_v10033257mg [Citrus x clementina]
MYWSRGADRNKEANFPDDINGKLQDRTLLNSGSTTELVSLTASKIISLEEGYINHLTTNREMIHRTLIKLP